MHIFVPNLNQEKLSITGDDYFHITRSLRKIVGDKLILVSLSDDFFAEAEIVEMSKKTLVAKVLKKVTKQPKNKPAITLIQAIIKRAGMELVLQKATELGVDWIIPLKTKYIVPKAEEVNLKRWETIMREAAVQSRRFYLPELGNPLDLKNLSMLKKQYPQIFCLAETQGSLNLKEHLTHLNKDISSLAVIIGPEGGFAPEELEGLKKEGIPLVSFGQTILRAETAAISMLSVLRWFFL
ncbi:MAG: RsmE family RNA methyltransferase [Candidatus Margulisbacteria bacterium]|nr:RsmE family RNA methyltransferase [Candidatus Margulisiibacteriota bacterium]